MLKVETSTCKYGKMSYLADDQWVGKSLHHYGEFSDAEVELMKRLIKPGDVVFDVGANFGSLTLPMAQLVGENGWVYAFEPQPQIYNLLSRNIRQNELKNIVPCNRAIGSSCGNISMPDLENLNSHNYSGVSLGSGDNTAEILTIDSLSLANVNFIKIDVEGFEREVIKGARETIKRCRPFLYVENDRPENSSRLISDIVGLGYRLYWHRPMLFSKTNFRRNSHNLFLAILSVNMICVPKENFVELEGFEEVVNLRVGLCCKAGLTHKEDYDRNIPPQYMASLSSIGVSWINLQWPPEPLPFQSEDHGDEIFDFLDSARVLQTLDLVVTVDTVVAHLAGALGIPCVVMLRYDNSWRWPNDKITSPWYPLTTQYRQDSPNDWTSVLEKVKIHIGKVVGSRKGS